MGRVPQKAKPHSSKKKCTRATRQSTTPSNNQAHRQMPPPQQQQNSTSLPTGSSRPARYARASSEEESEDDGVVVDPPISSSSSAVSSTSDDHGLTESLADITERHRRDHADQAGHWTPPQNRRASQWSELPDAILRDPGFDFYERRVRHRRRVTHYTTVQNIHPVAMDWSFLRSARLWQALCGVLVVGIALYIGWCHINGPEYQWLKMQRIRHLGLNLDDLR